MCAIGEIAARSAQADGGYVSSSEAVESVPRLAPASAAFESAIEAVSHALIHPNVRYRYRLLLIVGGHGRPFHHHQLLHWEAFVCRKLDLESNYDRKRVLLL
uniref:Uncharacterized protein n=1 Tax=Plectus sambesii TaxID=2011161 RepID=A0A914X7L7_9BILA